MKGLFRISKRFWSLALAFGLPALELFAERFRWYPDQEITRAILSAVCIALLIHSWFMQKKSVESHGRLTLWTLLLLFFLLEFLWLALNSMRGPNYPDDPNADNRLYWFVVEWQDRIVGLAKIVAGIIGVWIAVDLVHRVARYFKEKGGKIVSAS